MKRKGGNLDRLFCLEKSTSVHKKSFRVYLIGEKVVFLGLNESLKLVLIGIIFAFWDAPIFGLIKTSAVEEGELS